MHDSSERWRKERGRRRPWRPVSPLREWNLCPPVRGGAAAGNNVCSLDGVGTKSVCKKVYVSNVADQGISIQFLLHVNDVIQFWCNGVREAEIFFFPM